MAPFRLSWRERVEASVPKGKGVAARLAVWVLVVCALAVAGYWSGRLAIADHLSRSASRQDRERAVRLAPSAMFYERLADKREETGQNPIPDLLRAAALDPQNSERHLRLGLRAELEGDIALAERSLIRAAELSRLYAPRYALAQYYFRRENADGFWRWRQAALQSAYGDVTPLLELGRRMQPDVNVLTREAMTAKPLVARQWLAMLVRDGGVLEALPLARHIARSSAREDVPALLGYCNLSLSAGNADAAVDIWNSLCRRGQLPYEPLNRERGPWVTNPEFASAPLGTGLDWNVAKAPWLQSDHSPGELRVRLSGDQPEDCLLAWQYVPTVRGKKYRLRARLRGDGSGLSWIVFEPSGKWSGGRLQADGWLIFEAPADVIRLALMYRRPAGSARLRGTAVLTRIILDPAP